MKTNLKVWCVVCLRFVRSFLLRYALHAHVSIHDKIFATLALTCSIVTWCQVVWYRMPPAASVRNQITACLSRSRLSLSDTRDESVGRADPDSVLEGDHQDHGGDQLLPPNGGRSSAPPQLLPPKENRGSRSSPSGGAVVPTRGPERGTPADDAAEDVGPNDEEQNGPTERKTLLQRRTPLDDPADEDDHKGAKVGGQLTKSVLSKTGTNHSLGGELGGGTSTGTDEPWKGLHYDFLVVIIVILASVHNWEEIRFTQMSLRYEEWVHSQTGRDDRG